jgi:hypothetical protein
MDEMFFENEFTGSLTFLRLLFVMLIGLGPVAVTIVVKQALYRRRVAEDEMASSEGHAASAGSPLEDFAVTLANEINKLRRFEPPRIRPPAFYGRGRETALFGCC